MSESHNGEICTGSAGLLDWQLAYTVGQNVVRIQTSGPLDKTSFTTMFAAALASAELHQITRILADHRKSILRLNPLEIYYTPRVMVSSGAHPEFLLALVFSEITEDIQFMENVCRNSGLTVSVFTDIDLALQWLTEDPKPVAGQPQYTAANSARAKA